MLLKRKKTYKSLKKKKESILNDYYFIINQINNRLIYLCHKNPYIPVYDDMNNPNDIHTKYNTNDVLDDIHLTPIDIKLEIIRYLEENYKK